MKLNEIKKINESTEKNLLGLVIDGKEITKDTPNEVWIGDFSCYNNELKSLEYCPKEVHSDFNCSVNDLKTLEFCPVEVHGDFRCRNNQLKSLKGIHKQIHEMNGEINAYHNPITSHVIGILLVKGCTKIYLDNSGVMNILNKYLPNTSDMMSVLECQSELLDVGFEEFAEL